ncbi:MAG: hypothetical protein CMH56_17130 [Myxococcales bacterium]|nr:hypothetical protein [Myxococcales bacterium]|tara:strand:- start:1171 stop:2379 length:1209 start_codon:yes stop_codon:yes gene_type:complete
MPLGLEPIKFENCVFQPEPQVTFSFVQLQLKRTVRFAMFASNSRAIPKKGRREMATLETRAGLPILQLDEAPGRPRGLAHGELLKDAIHEIYAIRLELMLDKTDMIDEAEVLRAAAPHLDILRDFDEELFEEFMGISDASGLSAEKLVVVNHYTDLRDLSQKHLETLPPMDPGGCSVMFTPTNTGNVLGQTWDMHGSAQDHVIIIELPDAILFSIAGCLGMTGLNKHGVGMTINNLNSIDAKYGIIWPALVRGALQSTTAAQARDVVLNAPIGSGHHYVVADKDEVFGIETSGTKKKVIQEGASHIHLHTNHCLDDEMAQTARVPDESTSMKRLAGLENWVAGGAPQSAQAMFDGFTCVGMPREIGSHKSATCGALVMDLVQKHALACVGIPGENPAVTFQL